MRASQETAGPHLLQVQGCTLRTPWAAWEVLSARLPALGGEVHGGLVTAQAGDGPGRQPCSVESAGKKIAVVTGSWSFPETSKGSSEARPRVAGRESLQAGP